MPASFTMDAFRPDPNISTLASTRRSTHDQLNSAAFSSQPRKIDPTRYHDNAIDQRFNPRSANNMSLGTRPQLSDLGKRLAEERKLTKAKRARTQANGRFADWRNSTKKPAGWANSDGSHWEMKPKIGTTAEGKNGEIHDESTPMLGRATAALNKPIAEPDKTVQLVDRTIETSNSIASSARSIHHHQPTTSKPTNPSNTVVVSDDDDDDDDVIDLTFDDDTSNRQPAKPVRRTNTDDFDTDDVVIVREVQLENQPSRQPTNYNNQNNPQTASGHLSGPLKMPAPQPTRNHNLTPVDYTNLSGEELRRANPNTRMLTRAELLNSVKRVPTPFAMLQKRLARQARQVRQADRNMHEQITPGNYPTEIPHSGSTQRAPADTSVQNHHHSLLKYDPIPMSDEEEARHHVPKNLRRKKLNSVYGNVVGVTNRLYERAKVIGKEVGTALAQLQQVRVRFRMSPQSHNPQAQTDLSRLEPLIDYVAGQNRSLSADAELLRHNREELRKEWNYKLRLRDNLIVYSRILPENQRPPQMDMRHVNLAEFRKLFNSLRTRLDEIHKLKLGNETVGDAVGELTGTPKQHSASAVPHANVSSIPMVSADTSDEEPEILSVRDVPQREIIQEEKPKMKSESRPQDEWWNDEMFGKFGDTNPAANQFDDQFADISMESMNNPYMFSGYHRQDETESLKKLLSGIRPDEEYVEGMEKTPDDMLVPLLKHQRIGLAWMKAKEKSDTKGGILADDMGLGKTIQALAIMLLNRSTDAKCKTNLVITPVSLLQQWAQEARLKIKPSAGFSCYIYHQSNRLKSFEELSKYDMVLISYNTLASEWKKHFALAISEMKRSKKSDVPEYGSGGETYVSPFFSSNAKFYRIVLDEAQNIKNKLTNASRTVATLEGTYRWCLSGTPIQNRIEELYPQLRFLRIKPYCDEHQFKSQIASPIKSGWGETRAYSKVHAVLSAILLRRTKTSQIDGKPILELPEKHICIESVTMTDKEASFYKQLESSSAKLAQKLMQNNTKKKRAAVAGGVSTDTIDEAANVAAPDASIMPMMKRIGGGGAIGRNSNGSVYSSILTLLLRLRQACDHYYLVKIGEDKERTQQRDTIHEEVKACQGFNAGIIQLIDNEREDELVCQMCNEAIPEQEAYLLSGCGHVVCQDCLVPFFDENSDSGTGKNRTAKCTICRKPCLERYSVSIPVYDAVVKERLNWGQIKRRFSLDSRSADKAYRINKIKSLITEDGGKIMISAKVAKCIELVKSILAKNPDEKIIIFSQFTTFFDIMQIVLFACKLQYLRYDGTMDVDLKNQTVSTFYNDPTKKILLLSLKAGNVGLTLTCANHVILLEPFWNPYVEKQAQDRVHRISQTREVFVHRILVQGTVEDRIMELQEKKEKMVETALDPKARKYVNKLSRKELGFLFGLNGLATLDNDK